MKKIITIIHPAFVLTVMTLAISAQLFAQVTVKMRMNSSTCLDTLQPSHVAKIMGESQKGTTPPLSWTVADGLVMTNIGGDYWEGTFQAQPGDTIRFKFWTGFDATTGTSHWGGWDGTITATPPAGGNRILVVGNNDTTLALQYYVGDDGPRNQYWRPFESKPDSIAVYFRVNMGGADFNPATDVVDVRGGLPLGNSAWNPAIKVLTREVNSVNNGSFWSGVAYVHKDSIVAGTTQQEFKYVIQPDKWESIGNRSFVFKSKNDTTIHWSYYNNFPPSGPKVAATVLFTLKLDALEKANLFNAALGDKVAITGAKGWPPGTFNFDTEPTMLKMTYNPDIPGWERAEPFEKFPNEVIPYKYYISWDSSRVDSTSPNFIRGLQLSNGWEEPGVTGGADRNYVFGNTTEQFVPGDFGSDVQFFNSLHWKGAITTPIQVTFNINMAPAASAAENPGTLFRPGIDTAYIQFDGSLTAVTQGKTMWGTDNRLMLTDQDGDGKYTATWNMTPPTLYQFCYRIVYTSPSGEIWNGSGSAIRGRRYYQYVHPVKVLEDSAQWPATYSLAEMSWMLDSLTIEDPPNLDELTSVGGNNNGIVNGYELRQNYPNPFNPSTVITYTVPEKGHVKIAVYNVLGQLVTTLVNQEQIAGTHSVVWNAKASHAASGMYLLRMQAGSFTQVKKMLLTK